MRVVGLDIHRVFAEAVMLEDGTVRRLCRVGITRDHLTAFAKTLTHNDHVVVELTGNASAVAEVIRPRIGRVVIANPHQVRQRTRLKIIVHLTLHAHLVPPCPNADLFGPRGRAWLLAKVLPPDEGGAVAWHLRECDRLSEDLRGVERELARDALADPNAKRLMTIPGVDMVVAVGSIAAPGPNTRFLGPDRLVAHLGLNSSLHQSEGRPRHRRTTKHGRGHARTTLVEAARQAERGARSAARHLSARLKPSRAHFATIAVSRKLAVTIWRKLTPGQDYAWRHPVLRAKQIC